MALQDRARLIRSLCAAVAVGALLAAVTPLKAAEAEPGDRAIPPARDFATYVPTGQATRIEASEAPTIDGLLDDPAWAKAHVIDEFYQLDPDTGQPGSERTELR